jgi:hypothetical protein
MQRSGCEILAVGAQSLNHAILRPCIVGPDCIGDKAVRAVTPGDKSKGRPAACVRINPEISDTGKDSRRLCGIAEFEIVVCDDGSRDATGEILDRLARAHREVRPLHFAANQGAAAALTAAIADEFHTGAPQLQGVNLHIALEKREELYRYLQLLRFNKRPSRAECGILSDG